MIRSPDGERESAFISSTYRDSDTHSQSVFMRRKATTDPIHRDRGMRWTPRQTPTPLAVTGTPACMLHVAPKETCYSAYAAANDQVSGDGVSDDDVNVAAIYGESRACHSNVLY